MSRGVRDLRQLINQSRQVCVDGSSEAELENDDICCQATCALSKQFGQY